MNSKICPIGVQNFESLHKDDHFYINKTALVYQLAKAGRYYFLSRPRHFGKNLLISALGAYFQGKEELFGGLAIKILEEDWIKHPMLHLDLDIERCDVPESLDNTLERSLVAWEKLYGAKPSERSFPPHFADIIQHVCEKTGQCVVILVDEYDEPILQTIGDDELQRYYRNTLEPFYGALKSKDGHIKFTMLTDVTKFGKVSIFSDLNNLKDISVDERFIEICGIMEKEVHDNLEKKLHKLARNQKIGYDEVCEELKACYDDYRFIEDSVGTYNPFSLLNISDQMKFGDYWFETGTPTYLVGLLKSSHYDFRRVINVETDSDILNSIDSTSKDPIPVIYQSGYLMIKGYDRRFGIYRLGFPNRRVEGGLMKYLFPFYVNVDQIDSPFQTTKFIHEVEQGNCGAFFHRLQSFFADTPYELVRDSKLHYQNVLSIVFKLIGSCVKIECHISEGRVGLVLQTGKFIYVMEFKLDGTVEEAIKQINEKHYALPFGAGGRRLFKIGINFSSETCSIEKWMVE